MATVTVTSDYRVYAGETLTFTNQDAFYIQDPGSGAPDLTIEGTVNATSSAGSVIGIGIGASSFYDCVVLITNTGILRVTSTAIGGSAIGYTSGSWSPDFINRGLFEITARGTAKGLSTWDAGPWLFENSGAYRVTSSEADASGVFLANGGTFKNTGDFIVAGSTNVMAVGLNGFDSSFYNSGLIRATDGDPGSESTAVLYASTFSATDTFVNAGRIEGDYALRVSPYVQEIGGSQLFTNSGVMVGKVEMGVAATKLVNTGSISGTVDLDRGDDLYDGRQGVLSGALSAGDGADSVAGGSSNETLSGDGGSDTITGGAGDDLISGGRDSDSLDGGAGIDTVSYADATMSVSLDLAAGTASSSGNDTLANFERATGGGFADTLAGSAAAETLSGGAGDDSLTDNGGSNYLRGDDGNDSIRGGAQFDDINGNVGNDTASGGTGDDWVVGGKDNDSLFGEAGGDLVYGNLGADTCEGGDGNDIVRGGQDNDSVSGGGGDDYVSGDKGDDTVAGGAGADLFHTFGDAGIDRVTDFSLAQGDRVLLDPGTQYTVAQSGADTVISMTGGGQMILVGVQMSTLTTGWIFGG